MKKKEKNNEGKCNYMYIKRKKRKEKKRKGGKEKKTSG